MAEEDIKKLPPEERIKKLKELEKKRKKEIEDAQKVIKDSEQELTDRKKWVDKVPIPEFAQEDFIGLGEDAIRILEQHRGVQRKKEVSSGEKDKPRPAALDLEETLARDQTRLVVEANVQYGGPAQRGFGDVYKPLQDLTSREILGIVENIYQAQESRGYVLPGEQELLGRSLYEADRRRVAINEGNYNGSIDEAIQATSLIQQKAGQMYHAGSRANPQYQ